MTDDDFRPREEMGELLRSKASLGTMATQNASAVAITGGTITGTGLRLKTYTVATLPAGTEGDTAYVTDATAPTYLGVLTGGGAVKAPCFYNGSAWVSG